MDAIGDPMAGGVAACDFECRGGDVGGENFGARQLTGERDSKAAGTGAHVSDAKRRAGLAGGDSARAQALEGDFDDVFSLGARDQDGWRDFEFEAPEFLFASQILGWLAGSSARDQSEVLFGCGRLDWIFGMRVEPSAIATEDVEEQQFRSERVGWHIRRAQTRHAFFEHGANVESSWRLDGTEHTLLSYCNAQQQLDHVMRGDERR